MELRSCKLNFSLAVLCAFSLLFISVRAETLSKENHDHELTKAIDTEQKTDNLTRRQDNGFDFMKYFIGNSPQAQQQNHAQQQNQVQPRQYQQPLTIQQQHQLQQQQLAQQQIQQQQQLKQLQQQQLLEQLQQQQAARSNEVVQDNAAHQQQQSPAMNREGGYGSIGIGGYSQPPKQIGISIGGGVKPGNVVSVGNILTLLPRIFNILSAGGKVIFGVELGNNFYFGPVGAKPLYKG